MNHEKAKEILQQMESQPQFGKNMDSVILNGEYSIEQLQALLQLMEYTS